MSDNTRLIVKMVEHYMGIVNTTILDMTPKYISKELVQEVISHLILVYFGMSMGNYYTENHSHGSHVVFIVLIGHVVTVMSSQANCSLWFGCIFFSVDVLSGFRRSDQ